MANLWGQDQTWSAQEEHQIRGRLYRQGQKHDVVCYHLIAQNTADMVLSSLAQGKKQMMEAFLSTDKAKRKRLIWYWHGVSN